MNEDEESEDDDNQAIDEEKLNIKEKTSKMSEYARRREENIARNKELLKTTMLGSGYSKLIGDLKNKSANNKGALKNRKNTSTKQAEEHDSSSTVANDNDVTCQFTIVANEVYLLTLLGKSAYFAHPI